MGHLNGTPHLDEDSIKDLFIKTTTKLFEGKDGIIANFEVLETTAFNAVDLEKEKIQVNF